MEKKETIIKPNITTFDSWHGQYLVKIYWYSEYMS